MYVYVFITGMQVSQLARDGTSGNSTRWLLCCPTHGGMHLCVCKQLYIDDAHNGPLTYVPTYLPTYLQVKKFNSSQEGGGEYLLGSEIEQD